MNKYEKAFEKITSRTIVVIVGLFCIAVTYIIAKTLAELIIGPEAATVAGIIFSLALALILATSKDLKKLM